jgi:hypothetical protein
MGRACSRNGGEEEYIHNIGGKAEGKRPLGRPRCRWADNIKIIRDRMGLDGMGWDGMDWIDLVQDGDQWRALVNTVMHLRFP